MRRPLIIALTGMTLAVAGACGDSGGSAVTATAPPKTGPAPATTSEPDEDPAADALPVAVLDEDTLSREDAPPADIETLLDFRVGGDSPCPNIEGPPDLSTLVQFPGYTSVDSAQIGYSYTLCTGPIPARAQIADPSGEVMEKDVTEFLDFSAPIGTETGTYNVVVDSGGQTYEGDFELDHATEPRLYGTFGQFELSNYVIVPPGDRVELGLVGFEPDSEVLIGVYGSSGYQTGFVAITDSLGQARVAVPAPDSLDGDCLHLLADPALAVTYPTYGSEDSGLAAIDFSNPLDVEVCVMSDF